jgi:hypothetical protein
VAWVKLDDKRAMHRKFRRRGFAMRGLDEAAICHCAHEETDGFVSADAIEDLAHHHGVTTKEAGKLAGVLVDVGRWQRDEARNGWWIIGYLDHNPSHAELEAKREADRNRKRTRNGFQTDSDRNPGGVAADSKTPSRPSRPDRPDRTGEESKTSSSSAEREALA